MYIGTGQAPATRKYQTAAQIVGMMPACYSDEFDECIGEYEAADKAKRAPELTSYCAKWQDAWYNATPEAWDDAMEQVPYCSKDQIKSTMGYGIIGAAIIAGVVIGYAVKQKG